MGIEKKIYYIKGNSKCPEKVIEALIDLGGENFECKGSKENAIYYIDSQGYIDFTTEDKLLYKMLIEYGEEIFPNPDNKSKVSNKIKTWEDMWKKSIPIEGFFINKESYIIKTNTYSNPLHRNIYRTELQAKSALAMAQISQLIEQPIYGGWVPVEEKAFSLEVFNGSVVPRLNTTYCSGGILRFHTEDQALLFLENNESLVNQYLMIP